MGSVDLDSVEAGLVGLAGGVLGLGLAWLGLWLVRQQPDDYAKLALAVAKARRNMAEYCNLAVMDAVSAELNAPAVVRPAPSPPDPTDKALIRELSELVDSEEFKRADPLLYDKVQLRLKDEESR